MNIEIYHFNTYWSFILTLSFAYAFANKSFANHVSNYFSRVSFDDPNNRFRGLVKRLSVIKKEFETLSKPGGSAEHQRDYNNYHKDFTECKKKEKKFEENYEQFNTSLFLTKNFKSLCYLSGALALILIVAGGFLRESEILDSVFDGIRLGVYVWLFFIAIFIVFDVCFRKLKWVRNLGYGRSLLMVAVLLLITHVYVIYLLHWHDKAPVVHTNKSFTIIYLICLEGFHYVVYFIIAVVVYRRWCKSADTELENLESSISDLERRLVPFKKFEDWTIDSISISQ
ncbi:hypothetical protein [uncultured Draconibacterium sp.]|uniref:hypothetical protein n=1 Tax=uncultured Draconibacterium sp. TaxID=1573823 RepID=UPI0025D843BF|nr:hypothetical protein [uncultured Draconibacterium sp.]